MNRYMQIGLIAFPAIKIGLGKIIGKIVTVAKGLIGIFKGTSKETGELDAVNEKSSPEDVERVIDVFVNFKEQIHTRASEIEKTLMEELESYLEELREVLSNNLDKVEKYGIKVRKIERKINKISFNLKGIIDNELNKNVSLSNYECKEIVKMIPGAKKEKAMSDFLDVTVQEALNVCCNELRKCLDEIYEETSEEIVGVVDAIQANIMHLKEEYESINESNFEEQKVEKMMNAYYLIDVCNVVNEVI